MITKGIHYFKVLTSLNFASPNPSIHYCDWSIKANYMNLVSHSLCRPDCHWQPVSGDFLGAWPALHWGTLNWWDPNRKESWIVTFSVKLSLMLFSLPYFIPMEICFPIFNSTPCDSIVCHCWSPPLVCRAAQGPDHTYYIFIPRDSYYFLYKEDT